MSGHAFLAEPQHGRGVRRGAEEPGGGLVYAAVGRLGGENDGDEELERRAVVEFSPGFRIGFPQAREQRVPPLGVHRRRGQAGVGSG